MRRLMTQRRLPLIVLSVMAVSVLTGCGADCAPVSFLDLINTVLLGVTAAGGVVLLNNV